MKKIVINQYRPEPCGSTLGAHLFQYGINYHGNYSYSTTTTEEGLIFMMAIFQEAGYEVEFIEKWKPINEQ